MFGIEYLTVGGYIVDGGILCRDCGEKRNLPTGDSLSVATLEAEWPDGLGCGDCGTEIVETSDPPSLFTRLEDGNGFTVDLDGVDYDGQGFGISIPGMETRIPFSLLSDELLEDLQLTYCSVAWRIGAEAERENGTRPELYFGAWVDEGVVYFDLTRIMEDRTAAILLGGVNGQRAIFDFATGQSIDLTGPPRRICDHEVECDCHQRDPI